MKAHFKSYILALILLGTSVFSFANSDNNAACDTALKSKGIYLDDLTSLKEYREGQFIDAVRQFNSTLIKPKHKPRNILNTLAKPARVLTVPLKYLRGEARISPEIADFRAFVKKVDIGNGKTRDEIIFVKGLPGIMHSQERKDLDEFVSTNFKRIAIANSDPEVAWREFNRTFIKGELGLIQGTNRLTKRMIRYVWDGLTRKLPKFFLIHTTSYQYPLHEDINNFKIRFEDDQGQVEYLSWKDHPELIEMYYLLNDHVPNKVEGAARFGADMRAAAFLTLLFYAVGYADLSIDRGEVILDKSVWIPALTLAASRSFAGILALLRNGIYLPSYTNFKIGLR
ncbi:MAG: hypothetical protein KDD40_10690, partial [Bdellovibrionales bacterium]|nr:hypothetical protein [Bdellovibrionales bacterium]